MADGHILKLRDASLITHALIGGLAIAAGGETRDGHRAKLAADRLSGDAIDGIMGALGGL